MRNYGQPLPVSDGGTGAKTPAGAIANLGIISPSLPLANGTAGAGSTGQAADAGHVHPTDATRAPLSAISGLISGLRLSNDVTSPNTVLDIATGVATSDDNTTAITLSSAVTKTTGAWAAGTGKGGLDTGSVAASTWYHAFLISGTGGTDLLLSKSATAPTMPTGYTVKRRVGSFKTNSSSQIIAFNQTGDRFDLATPFVEINGSFGQTTAVTYALASVPTGVPVQALLSGSCSDGNGGSPILYISSVAQADLVPSNSAYTAQGTGAGIGTYAVSVVTNASAQVRFRTQTSTLNIVVITNGYIDARGR